MLDICSSAFHTCVYRTRDCAIGNETASGRSRMMLEYAISRLRYAIVPQKGRRALIDPCPAPHVHAHARTRHPLSPINYRDISRRTRACAVALCTCIPQCNVRVMHSCGPAHSVRPAYRCKRGRALSPGSCRSSPSHTSFNLRDRTKEKDEENSQCSRLRLHHHKDFN